MARGIHQVAVILVVLIAGCSGIAGVNGAPAVSVTPANVPTDIVTQTGTEAKPFLLPNGSFSDPMAMAAHHRNLLQGQSYTVVSTRTIRFPVSNRTGQWELTASIGSSGPFTVETVRHGTIFGTDRPVQIGFWSDGDIVVEAFLANDTATANIVRDARGNPVPPSTVMPIDPRFEGELRAIFATTRVQTVTRVNDESSSPDLVRITAAGPVGGGIAGGLASVTSVRNLSVELDIDERGFVERFRVRYNGQFAGEPVTVTRTVRYTKVGETTVHRPEWVDGALQGTDYEPSNGTNASS